MDDRKDSGHSSKFVKSDGKPVETRAVHRESEDGTQHVELSNLAVMVTNDDGSWFAQGLEIDYFVQGTDFDDLKRRFETGLAKTIEEYLSAYGSIEHLLRPAPQAVWDEFAKCQGNHLLFSHVAVYRSKLVVGEFQQEIAYYTPKAA